MHRKLHRSVTEILRSLICLPNLSRKVITVIAEKQKARFFLAQGLKAVSFEPRWNRARRKTAYSRCSVLSNATALADDSCESMVHPVPIREAPAFPPEPSSQIPGSPG